MNPAKKSIFLTIALDLIGLTMIFPIFPVLITRFGISTLMVGMIGAVYALCSFVAGPYLGRLSDRMGRKKILVTSILGSAVGWIITAFAPNVWFVFLGRIIDGVTAGNITIAQAILGDISKDSKERAKNFGFFGMMFGMAMIIGPLLGGFLIRFGFFVPFLVSGIFSIVNAILVSTYLPETLPKHTEALPESKGFAIFDALFHSKLAAYLWLSFIVGLGAGVYRNSFGIYMDAFYHLDPSQISYVLAIAGVFMAVCQGYFLNNFWLRKFTSKKILTINLIASVVFFTITASYDQSANPHIVIWMICDLCMVFFTIAMWPVLQAEGMSHADPRRRGEVSGYFSSLWNLTAIAAPLIGAWMIGIHLSPLWAASLLSLVGFFWFIGMRKRGVFEG